MPDLKRSSAAAHGQDRSRPTPSLLLPPLLLTSSVGVAAPFVKLNDPAERAELTLHSVGRWLEIAPGLPIVLCDGSGHDFASACAERFPGAHVECLSFRNDFVSVQKFGKGYGEGEIVMHALANSALLRDATVFAKCTAKWWVSNFLDLWADWNGVFQCAFKFKHKNSIRKIAALLVDTRFYITDKELFLKHFADAHLTVRDHDRYYLEHSFKDRLIGSNADVMRYIFPRAPRIEGVSGTSAEIHKAGPMAAERLFKHTYRRYLVMLNQRLFPR